MSGHTELQPEQKHRLVLGAVAEKQLKTGKPVTGRFVRSSFHNFPPEEVDKVLDECVPILLNRSGSHPHDEYGLTLEGLIHTKEGSKASRFIEHFLSFLRKMERNNPGFEIYDWTQIQESINNSDMLGGFDFIFVVSCLQIAELTNSCNWSQGTTPKFSSKTPSDIEKILRCEFFLDFSHLRKKRRLVSTSSSTQSVAIPGMVKSSRDLGKSPGTNKVTGVSSDRVDFVIITALKEEKGAVLDKLQGAQKLDKDSHDIHTYYEAKVLTRRSDGAVYRVIATCLADMGPIMAAVKAAAVVNRWHPKHVLLVGIACGIKSEAHYGDVLVAKQIADYTLGKQLPNGKRETRWEVHQAGPSLFDSAVNLSEEWRKLIKVTRPGEGAPERCYGVIASGGDVISNDDVVSAYRDDWAKLIGIEMESGGTVTSLYNTPDRPEFLMIKAVSDFGKDKHEPSLKPWRLYACDVAAAFAMFLLRSGPSPTVTKSTQTTGGENASNKASGGSLDAVKNYLQAESGCELSLMELPDDIGNRIALKFNQGTKIIVDKPVYWQDFEGEARVPFPRQIEVESNHSREIRTEGTFSHSSEGHSRAVHSIRFVISNSGDKTLILSRARLLVLHSERNEDHHILGIAPEAGPVRTVIVEGIELTPETTDLVLKDEAYYIEPNGVLALKFEFKSPDNYNYRVKFAFDWADPYKKSEHTAFSDTYLLKYPSYDCSARLFDSLSEDEIPVLPILDSGRIHPVAARIILNPKHSHYEDVVLVVKYDEYGKSLPVYKDFLRAVIKDLKADKQIRYNASLSLLILEEKTTLESYEDPYELPLSIGQRILNKQARDTSAYFPRKMNSVFLPFS